MFFVSLAVAAVFVETQQYYPGNKILCSSSTSKKEKARNRGFFFFEFTGSVPHLVVSTHLKNIGQIGSFPQVGVKIKKI